MTDIIRKNYGGFNVRIVEVPVPSVTTIGELKYRINKNLPLKENQKAYVTEVYINGIFVFETAATVIDLSTIPGIKDTFRRHQKIIIQFVQKKTIGQIKTSEPREIVEQYLVACDQLLCGENNICKDTIVEEDTDNGISSHGMGE